MQNQQENIKDLNNNEQLEQQEKQDVQEEKEDVQEEEVEVEEEEKEKDPQLNMQNREVQTLNKTTREIQDRLTSGLTNKDLKNIFTSQDKNGNKIPNKVKIKFPKKWTLKDGKFNEEDLKSLLKVNNNKLDFGDTASKDDFTLKITLNNDNLQIIQKGLHTDKKSLEKVINVDVLNAKLQLVKIKNYFKSRKENENLDITYEEAQELIEKTKAYQDLKQSDKQNENQANEIKLNKAEVELQQGIQEFLSTKNAQPAEIPFNKSYITLSKTTGEIAIKLNEIKKDYLKQCNEIEDKNFELQGALKNSSNNIAENNDNKDDKIQELKEKIAENNDNKDDKIQELKEKIAENQKTITEYKTQAQEQIKAYFANIVVHKQEGNKLDDITFDLDSEKDIDGKDVRDALSKAKCRSSSMATNTKDQIYSNIYDGVAKPLWDSGILGQLTSFVVGKGTVEDFNSGTGWGKAKALGKTIVVLGVAITAGAFLGTMVLSTGVIGLLPAIAIGLGGAALAINTIKKIDGIGRNFAGNLRQKLKKAEDTAISMANKNQDLSEKIKINTAFYQNQKKASSESGIKYAIATLLLCGVAYFIPPVALYAICASLYTGYKSLSKASKCIEANHNIKTESKAARDKILSENSVQQNLVKAFNQAGISQDVQKTYFDDKDELRTYLKREKSVTSNTKYGGNISDLMNSQPFNKKVDSIKSGYATINDRLAEKDVKEDKFRNKYKKTLSMLR